MPDKTAASTSLTTATTHKLIRKSFHPRGKFLELCPQVATGLSGIQVGNRTFFGGGRITASLIVFFHLWPEIQKKTFHLLLHQFARVAKSLTAIVIIVRFQFRELNSLLLLPFADKSWPGLVVVVGSGAGGWGGGIWQHINKKGAGSALLSDLEYLRDLTTGPTFGYCFGFRRNVK